jgi:hypothetical protein
MKSGSFDTDAEGVIKSIKQALMGNTIAIDLVLIPVWKKHVLFGSFEDGPAGVMTLFQSDLGLVRWTDEAGLFRAVDRAFHNAFFDTDPEPYYFPVRALDHVSYNGTKKLLVYFGVLLKQKVALRPGGRFAHIEWVIGTQTGHIDEHLSKLRVRKKAHAHREAIMSALTFAERGTRQRSAA